jgi:hypothetical protein
MNEETGLEAFESTLDQAVKQMRGLEARLKAGEIVSDDEIDAIAKQAASGLEEALDVLKEILGSDDEAPLEPQEYIPENQPSPAWMAVIQEAEAPRMRAGEASAL